MQKTTSLNAPLSAGLTWLGVTAVVVLAIGAFVLVAGRFVTAVGPLREAHSGADLVVRTEQFRFGDEMLRVRAGETVTLQLDNADAVLHSFDIDALDVHADMEAGSSRTITFSAPADGTFEFYCGVAGHREAGMVGTLVIDGE